MKKLILATIFCLFAVASFAQKNALGLRAGAGTELQYERFLNSGNVLKVNAGMFDFDGSFFGTVVHNWEILNWGGSDNWFLQLGVGGSVGLYNNGESGDINVGVSGNAAVGYRIAGAPISLAVDYRPTVLFLHDAWGKGFGNWGLSCVFHF